jgi:hypothetical protein
MALKKATTVEAARKAVEPYVKIVSVSSGL